MYEDIMFAKAEVLLVYRPEMGSTFETRSVLVYNHKGIDIIVPAFFQTDLASVPWMGRWLFKIHGRYTLAAIIHDWLYACNGYITLPGGGEWSYTREQADMVFLEAMRASGVGKAKSQTLYRAVRLGGWWSWNNHSRT